MENDNLKTTQNVNVSDDFVDEYSEALSAVPEEVRRFMWSDAFKIIIKAIAKTYNLSEEQSKVVEQIAVETLLEIITPIARQARLSSANITGDLQDAVLQAINEEIVSRALTQIEIQNDLDTEEATAEETTSQAVISAPSPLEALASIQEKLAKPAAIAPIKRDYSLEKPAANSTPAQKPTFDIYREVPEK